MYDWTLIVSTCSSMAIETAVTGEPLTVDLRLYNTLLDSVPQNAITIPLILHCMAEQVLL